MVFHFSQVRKKGRQKGRLWDMMGLREDVCDDRRRTAFLIMLNTGCQRLQKAGTQTHRDAGA